MPLVDEGILWIDSQRLRSHLRQTQCGAARRVALRPMVHLHDLDLVRRAEGLRRLGHQPEEDVDSDAHVRSEQERDPPRQAAQLVLLLGAQSGGSDHQRHAACRADRRVLHRRRRGREVDHHVRTVLQRGLDSRSDPDSAGVAADVLRTGALEGARDREILLLPQHGEDARPHPAGSAGDHRPDHNKPPYSRIADSTFAAPASEMGTSGRRRSGPIFPIL